MKSFFKQYSYNIVKNLINQFAISVFGAFLSMATSAADKTWLTVSVSVFAIVFYLFLIYTTTWEIGAKDRVSVDVGKKKYHPMTGLFIALISNIPNFLIAIAFAITTALAAPENLATNINAILRLASMILQGMYTGLMITVPVAGTTLVNTWWAYFVIIIPALIASWIAYYAGFKNFRLIAPLFDKKKPNKK